MSQTAYRDTSPDIFENEFMISENEVIDLNRTMISEEERVSINGTDFTNVADDITITSSQAMQFILPGSQSTIITVDDLSQELRMLSRSEQEDDAEPVLSELITRDYGREQEDIKPNCRKRSAACLLNENAVYEPEAWTDGGLEYENSTFFNQQVVSMGHTHRDQMFEGGGSNMLAPLRNEEDFHVQGPPLPSNYDEPQQKQPLDNPQKFTVTVATQSKNSNNLDYFTIGGADGVTLCCKLDVVVPFILRYPPGHPADRLRIRAEFVDECEKNKPVERCPNHRSKDESVFRNHFVRTTVSPPTADYRNEDEGYCIIVPAPDSIKLIFTCYSSCIKKTVRLVFTLLASDGRSSEQTSMILKVCANPRRDGFSKDTFRSKKRVSTSRGRVAALGIKREEPLSTNSAPPNNLLQSSSSDDMVYCVQVKGTTMYRRVMAMLAEAEKTARYDAQRLEKLGFAPSPFRDVSSIGADSSVSQWLQLPGIDLESYAEVFHRNGIYTMTNLAEQYHGELFASFGFNKEPCSKLNRLYLNWYTVYKTDHTLPAHNS